MNGRRIVIAGGLVVTALLVAGGAWWWHGCRCEAKNRKAQMAFSEDLKKFDTLKRDPKTQSAAWDDVQKSFGRDYEQYADSSLAPYFLAFQSEATARTGNHAEAVILLERAIEKMGNTAPLYYLYAVKLATLIIESPETAERGRKELLALANDRKNPYQGLAWYQLWYYAWTANDKELVTMAHAKLQAHAEWSALARSQSEALASDTHDAA